MNDKSLYDLERSGLEGFLEDLGERSFRAQQIWHGTYVDLAPSYDDITTLSKTLRAKLARELPLDTLQVASTLESRDKRTRKSLFRLSDGDTIEAVLMLYDKRRTICVSTQVGCAIGCAFCATGKSGFTRDLSAGEIVAQVLHFARDLASRGERITNIVYMGMGEPFLNYDAVMKSIRILNDHNGFNLGARSFTISTVGIIPGIERFTEEDSQVNLAISLHAGDDELRTRLVPINEHYPLGPLMASCRAYVRKTHRRLTFEIALIDGVNDSANDAHKVAKLLAGLLCHVNLIPLNPIPSSIFRPSPREQVDAFAKELTDAGINTTVRMGRGVKISAGCGQLRGRSH
ncbi:MAG TPA: 23S rRNA (adenine(2503)-C(2))-methyltransferase RlmN [Candidatus Acetothermia bacterium]|nr:23S rRNA (adenine(2503)-C(2))-methyltransferase RlmN [Candidatus Acetothermia bacterium]